MRLQLMGWMVVSVFLSQTAWAAPRSFPYEAIVDAEEVYVRSGPGKDKYYPTSKLRRGDRVTVIRHDPGGWFVIVPPADSFSWIPTEFVKPTEGNRGLVAASSFVRIGSTFGENTHDIRHRISAGETVHILEEKTLQTERGPVPMYKIKPIQGEYRYVPGAAVIAADAVPQKESTNDPFAPSQDVKTDEKAGNVPPPNQSQSQPIAENKTSRTQDRSRKPGQLVERPLIRTTEDRATAAGSPSTERTFAELDRLRSIDAEFRAMIRRDTQEWNLEDLERKYTALLEQARSPLLPGEVDRRLAELDRWKKIEQEYHDFLRLTSETNRRDAQLLSMAEQNVQEARPEQERPLSDVPASEPAPTAEPQSFPPQHQPDSRPQAPAPSQRESAPVQEPTRRSAPFTTRVHRKPQFDGAGIVQRSATTYPGAPRHVLMAPNGRILAYLQSSVPGLNLDRYLGRAMGIVGQRSFRPDLQADFIAVRSLAPVRLIP